MTAGLWFPAGAEGLFTVFVVGSDQTPVVWVVGEVDLFSEPQLLSVVFALRGAGAVTVDLSRVTFCDQTLVRFVDELRRGHVLAVRDAPRLCRELLRLSERPVQRSDRARTLPRRELDLRAAAQALTSLPG